MTSHLQSSVKHSDAPDTDTRNLRAPRAPDPIRRGLLACHVALAMLLSACGGSSGSIAPGPGDDGGGTDTTAPVLKIVSPTPDEIVHATVPFLSVTGTVTDDNTVREITWLNTEDGSVGAGELSSPGAASGDWSVADIPLATGTNILQFQAVDATGNTGSVSLVVAYGSDTGDAYFLSPTGSDANDGQSPAAPWKTFAAAFSRMAGGDQLVLLDGTYSDAAGTGKIGCAGAYPCDGGPATAMPPSGMSLSAMTVVRSLNPGKVFVDGGIILGHRDLKSTHIRIQGITFKGGGTLYNTGFVTIKDSGFEGPFGIGTNDHAQGNSDNLIEDVWVWAAGARIIASNYRSHRNVWRRVVVRGDGCNASDCLGAGNPNVGITVYDSQEVLFQNVMVVDRILGGGSPYADFATAQHTPDASFYLGRNKWQGCISIRSPDQAFNFEADDVVGPTRSIRDCMAWGGGGLNMGGEGIDDSFQNLTIHTVGDDAIRVAPDASLIGGTIRDVAGLGSGRYAINSKFQPTNACASGSFSSLYNQTTPAGNVCASDPLSDGSIRYPVRIEAGSPLKGRGTSGADIGANIVYKLGINGSRHGQAGVEIVTANPLWPWPNEARIKREMCTGTTRGFCSTGKRLDGTNPVTLTSYVWELLGVPLPAGLYR